MAFVVRGHENKQSSFRKSNLGICVYVCATDVTLCCQNMSAPQLPFPLWLLYRPCSRITVVGHLKGICRHLFNLKSPTLAKVQCQSKATKRCPYADVMKSLFDFHKLSPATISSSLQVVGKWECCDDASSRTGGEWVPWRAWPHPQRVANSKAISFSCTWLRQSSM